MSQPTNSQQANIAATKRFGEIVNGGELDRFGEVVAPDAVDHDPAPGQGKGPQGYAHFFGMMRSAFPDMQVEVDQMVADQDRVAFAYTLTGTQRGDFMGVAPTGKSVRVRGVQIGRFENGLMVERWGSSDELGLLRQLGVSFPSSA